MVNIERILPLVLVCACSGSGSEAGADAASDGVPDTLDDTHDAGDVETDLGDTALAETADAPESDGAVEPIEAELVADEVQTFGAALAAQVEAGDGGGIDGLYRNSGVVIDETAGTYFAVNGVHAVTPGDYTSYYPKSIVEASLADDTLVRAWSFSGLNGHEVDMEALSFAAADGLLYVGDEYNYIYELELASGSVLREWDLADIGIDTPVDWGIEALSWSRQTGHFYAGIQGKQRIYALDLHLDGEGGAPVVSEIGSFPMPSGWSPTGLDTHSDGTLYVLAVRLVGGGQAIYRFAVDGTLLCNVTIPDSLGLVRPDGLALGDGHIYIADSQGPLEGGASLYRVAWKNPCDTADTTPEAPACSGWDLLDTLYPDVALEDLGPCGEGRGAFVAGTLMDLEGIVISGSSVAGPNGMTTARPCVEIRCDADYAYIASNALPHYDPEALPIFKTQGTPIVHRIPLEPAPIPVGVAADLWEAPRGCDEALRLHVAGELPDAPPFNHCWYETSDGSATTGERYISDGVATVHKVHCYGQTAGLINGVPAFAPCEERIPDPYGSPLFRSWADRDEPFVDLCGQHPASITHAHWVNEVCFERDAEGRPANDYATGAAAFDVAALDQPSCSETSDIVGWSYDGYPLRGSCLCMARAADGSCSDLRRARSGYVYAGLARWADDTSVDPDLHGDAVMASDLANELAPCASVADCCPGTGSCLLFCQPLLVESSGAVALESRCVTADYSWCNHAYREHADALEDAGYVYLDRCNGVETADGYSYVGTMTFPYVNACYRSRPTAMAVDDTYTRLLESLGP